MRAGYEVRLPPEGTYTWAGRRKQRTLNMLPMYVTREVSQLSGWLNLSAPCAEGRNHRACAVWGGLRTRGSGRRRAIAQGVPAATWGGHMTADCGGARRGEQRTQNMPSMFVTRDVSQPEISALKLYIL